MATLALIQNKFRVLHHTSSDRLHGLEKQIFDNFFEAIEEEYNHRVCAAQTLEDYQSRNLPTPEVILCTPLPEEGNPASGLERLAQIQKTFPGVPVIVWTTRTEPSLRNTCLNEYGCAGYYTGTLLDAPEELPGLIAEALKKSAP